MFAPQLRARIDPTPFIGVLLPLMAVFLVAMPPERPDAAFDQSLHDFPDSPNHPGPVFISILHGDIYVCGHRSSSDRLEADVDQALRQSKLANRSVMVRADADVSYGDFFAVTDRLQRDGYRVRLINEDIE